MPMLLRCVQKSVWHVMLVTSRPATMSQNWHWTDTNAELPNLDHRCRVAVEQHSFGSCTNEPDERSSHDPFISCCARTRLEGPDRYVSPATGTRMEADRRRATT